MGLYIPGMEMPKGSRRAVSIVICSDGSVYYDGLTKLDFKAISVPPHGRLGNLDALKVKAIERSEKCSGYVNVLDNVITAYDIETAPTIIPAEEEK